MRPLTEDELRRAIRKRYDAMVTLRIIGDYKIESVDVEAQAVTVAFKLHTVTTCDLLRLDDDRVRECLR